jgi:predicted ester cyclase
MLEQKMSPTKMSAEQIKTEIRHMFEELNKKNLSVFDEVAAPDVISHLTNGTELKNIETWKQHVNVLFSAFPDAHFTLDDIVVEGDTAAFRYTETGTYKGRLGNPAPKEKKVTDTVFVFFHYECSKVVEQWGMLNQLGWYEQLGIIPHTMSSHINTMNMLASG